MPSKYCLLLLLLPAFVPATAQNIPDLSATGPAGTATYAIPVPPDLSSTAQPNWLRSYVPKLPIADASSINVNNSPAAVQTTTEYKDGFSRTVQTVQHYATTGSKPHLVLPSDTRFRTEQVSFLPYPATDAGYHNNLFAIQHYYYTNIAHVNEHYTPYQVSKNASTAQLRAIKTLAPGLSQVGQNRGVTVEQITNAASEVKIWEPDVDGKPVLIGSYAAGTLMGEKTYDDVGAVVTAFKDKDGRLICRTVRQEDQNQGGAIATISGTTYYVYNTLGNLVCVMPPKATAASVASVSPTVFDNLCFRYQYDDKGRLAGQRFPGEADFTEFVYDLKDRLVLTRTPNDMAANVWKVTFYDRNGRSKATSVVSNPASRQDLQALVDAGTTTTNPADIRYYMTPEGEGVYPAENAIAGNTMMSYTYYDDYSLADPGDTVRSQATIALLFNSEALTTSGSEAPLTGAHQQGRITGSKIRILPAPGVSTSETGEWRRSVTFYDKKGRVVYTASKDEYQGTMVHAHYTGMQYDFANRLIYSKHVMRNPSGNTTEHKEWDHYEYDLLTGQATRSWHKVDSSAWALQTSNKYDDLGRVSREILGDWGEVRDYNYNIRGQLKGINEYYARTGDGQGESRSFGESLSYDYGFTVPRYDGKISGMLWRGSGETNAYGYTYDYSGRLTQAEYRRDETGSGGWSKSLADYTVSNLTYDRDGNIKSMRQKAVQPGGGVVDMDRLTYTYANSEESNRLNKVVDIAPFYNLGDFNNTNGTNSDYNYDRNGNLVLDNNKGITGVTYTHFNKPQTISLGAGRSIAYSYDAAGNKVQEKITDSSSTVSVLNYIGNFVYKGNNLQHVNTKEGRTVYDKDTRRFTEEYFVKDHLNNVRSVVEVYVPPTAVYFATYEIASANLEGMVFDHMDQVRDTRPGGGPGNAHAGNLNGSDPNRRIGTSMLLRVMAGDKIEMNVNNFYERYERDNDAPISTSDMLSTIISTLTTGTGGFPASESHNTKTVTDVFTAPNYSIFDLAVNSTADPNRPRAYLNYIMFDENMEIVPGMSGAFQADGAGDWTTIGTSTPLEFPTNGYLAVYLSNASRNLSADMYGNVYFDQLVIRFSRGKLKEEAHYYPHGLPMANMGSTASGYVANRRKYQSNEYITNLDLNWMDFNNRQYDPQIGRFLGVDPLANSSHQAMLSPYAAMANNPILFVDPDGLENMIYVINRSSSGISTGQMQERISSWNAKLAEFGLSARFILFEPMMGEEFNMAGVGETDAVMVFGEKNDISGYIQNTLGVSQFSSSWTDNNTGKTLTGVSAISIEDVTSTASLDKADFTTELEFTALHEAGHNTRHPTIGYKVSRDHALISEEGNALMWDGYVVNGKMYGKTFRVDGRFITVPKDSRFNNLNDFMRKEYNANYINSMSAFFSSDYTKDNYRNRLIYPNRSAWFYKWIAP